MALMVLESDKFINQLDIQNGVVVQVKMLV